MVLKRMLFIAVIIIIINAIMISPIYAMGDVISSGKDFLKEGQEANPVIDTGALRDTSNFIFNMLLVIAIVLAVGVGTVLGIKFITSSVEGQAKIKEAIIPYIVGCVVIFAAFPIWSFIVDAGQDATGIDPDAVFEGEYRTAECAEEGCGLVQFSLEEIKSTKKIGGGIYFIGVCNKGHKYPYCYIEDEEKLTCLPGLSIDSVPVLRDKKVEGEKNRI